MGDLIGVIFVTIGVIYLFNIFREKKENKIDRFSGWYSLRTYLAGKKPKEIKKETDPAKFKIALIGQVIIAILLISYGIYLLIKG